MRDRSPAPSARHARQARRSVLPPCLRTRSGLSEIRRSAPRQPCTSRGHGAGTTRQQQNVTVHFAGVQVRLGFWLARVGARGPLGHHSSPRRSAAGAAAAKSGVVPRAPSPECGGDDADDSASGLVIGLCIRGRRQPAASGGRSLAVTPELKVACDCRRGRVSRRAGRRWRSGPLADAGQGGQRHGVRCTVRRAVGEPLRMAPLTGADVPLQRRSAWLGPCQQRPCRQRLQSRRLSAARPSPTSRSSGGYARTHTHTRARAHL